MIGHVKPEGQITSKISYTFAKILKKSSEILKISKNLHILKIFRILEIPKKILAILKISKSPRNLLNK